MRIGICDDNVRDLEAMREMLCAVSPKDTVDVYSDGGALLDTVSKGISYDLLFLDIIMPRLSGIELSKEISEIAPEIPVVFLTDSDAYAVEAFSINALHYIIKPMTEDALKQCLQRLEVKQNARKRVHIISSSGIRHMLFADEIQFAESDGHYNNLHLEDGTVVKVRMTQSDIQDQLGSAFLPISRGLLVNMGFIRQFGPRSCHLMDGREILLSRKNLDQLNTTYASYVFSQLLQHERS